VESQKGRQYHNSGSNRVQAEAVILVVCCYNRGRSHSTIASCIDAVVPGKMLLALAVTAATAAATWQVDVMRHVTHINIAHEPDAES